MQNCCKAHELVPVMSELNHSLNALSELWTCPFNHIPYTFFNCLSKKTKTHNQPIQAGKNIIGGWLCWQFAAWNPNKHHYRSQDPERIIFRIWQVALAWWVQSPNIQQTSNNFWLVEFSCIVGVERSPWTFCSGPCHGGTMDLLKSTCWEMLRNLRCSKCQISILQPPTRRRKKVETGKTPSSEPKWLVTPS